jgi:single-stranded DNA-binding protein
MQTRTWDDKDGKKNYRTELVADEVSLLARYEKSADGAASASSNSSSDASSDQEINPEDLPF